MLFGFFSMFFNSYRLDLHNKTRVALAIYGETFAKNRIKIWTPVSLVMVVGSACLLVS